MGRQIVHDDDIAGAERRGEALFDPGLEDGAVHGLVDDHGRVDAILAQRGDEGRRLPMSVGHGGDEPFTAA